MRFVDLAIDEHFVPRHEHIVEMNDCNRLSELGAEFGSGVAGAARWARDNRNARRIDWHRAGHSKVAVFLAHAAAWQHQIFVHVRRAGHDGLYASDHDPIGAAFLYMDIRERLGLLGRAL